MSKYYRAEAVKEIITELLKEPSFLHDGEDYYAGIHAVGTEIKFFPKESTIELVRCEECVYRHSPDGNDVYCCKHASGISGVVKNDYFCSFGSRY